MINLMKQPRREGCFKKKKKKKRVVDVNALLKSGNIMANDYVITSIRRFRNTPRERFEISLLILSKFKQNNRLLSPP